LGDWVNASGQNGVAPMAQCFLSMMHLMLAQAATRESSMKGEGSVRFTSSLDQLNFCWKIFLTFLQNKMP
jgi:hypothetical protein